MLRACPNNAKRPWWFSTATAVSHFSLCRSENETARCAATRHVIAMSIIRRYAVCHSAISTPRYPMECCFGLLCYATVFR